jgi:hypothetical protein
MMSLPIGCMKFLFPKLFITISQLPCVLNSVWFSRISAIVLNFILILLSGPIRIN